MAGYPTRLAPSGTVPEGPTELWKDRKRYLWLIGLVVPSLAFVAFGVSIRCRSSANSPVVRSTGAALMPVPPKSMPIACAVMARR